MAPLMAPIRTALAGMIALAVAMGIGRFAFTPILPMMREDAGVSLAQGGWLASANYLGYLLGALWAGAQAARSTVAIRVALVAIAVTTLAMAIAPGMGAWLALRTLAGIASAWALVHVSAWSMERLAPAGNPLYGGIVFAGVGAGMAVAGIACLLAIRLGADSSQAWLALGMLAALAAAAIWPQFHAGDAKSGAS